MKRYQQLIHITLLVLAFGSCDKAEFLDKKPNTNLLVPKTLTDFQAMLDNSAMLYLGGLGQLSSDEYVVSDIGYSSVPDVVQRNAYIWTKDLYGGTQGIRDWNDLYKGVFYANAVLDGLEGSPESDTAQGQYLKGWALFARAYAFYDLTRNFCKVYDATTANADLGIPLRLKSGIDYLEQRATLQETFNQILGDLSIAESLLPSVRPASNLNRPSKIAVYALLARVYLDMRNYPDAEANADRCLNLYSTLIDYTTVSKTSATPFSVTNNELIYNTTYVSAFGEFIGAFTAATGRVAPNMISLYSANDLRLPIYFNKFPDNTYTKKRGYIGAGAYGFTGLATDEVYLVKAECLARRNEANLAMTWLNELASKRWDPSATNPAVPYAKITASNPSEALQKVLLERRKELVWRGLRWHDLKRLNKEGANITLSRTVNGTTHTLPPNDLRWVFPIPDDEIQLSGIEQNIR